MNFRALGREDSRRYENYCLHSLKAMSLRAKKDARLKPAATFAGAEIGLRSDRNDSLGTPLWTDVSREACTDRNQLPSSLSLGWP
jgi:hypothetical protein